MTIDYQGREVVVTGGQGALGSGVVDLLVAAGASCHLPVLKVRKAQGDGSRKGVRLVEGVDLRDPGQVREFYGALPGLWASIHCAGGFSMGPFEETDLESLLSQFQLNVVTCFNCCREAVRLIARSGQGGRILNVAARPALEPRLGAGMVPYTMSKSAVAALTIALGEEIAGAGVLVNAVAPSILDTAANRAALPDADPSGWPSVEEVAATISFLASPQNRVTRSSVVSVFGKA